MSVMGKEQRIRLEGEPKYGRYYWCIKVPKSLSTNGEIYIHADKPVIHPNGELELVGAFREYVDSPPQREAPNLILAPGQWLCIYAASVIDGSAIAVSHWEGEVVR
jgi:hypothetical protein